MSRTFKIRCAAWIVMLASGGLFLVGVRNAPSGEIAPRELMIAVLPHQIASAALLALFWVGPFPESWPLIGGTNRFGRFLFWLFAGVLGAFWLYFYARFILGLV